jgi:hypothetical protein
MTRTMDVSSARRKKKAKKTKVSHGEGGSDGRGHELFLFSFLFSNTGPRVSSREERPLSRADARKQVSVASHTPTLAQAPHLP